MKNIAPVVFLILFGCSMTVNAQEVLLAKKWSTDLNPANYWVSEKLDGVRAVWDGHALYSKSGNPIHAPKWFTEGFPKVALDGELWIGREKFEQVAATVLDQRPNDANWQQVGYHIFELPEGAGDFTQRAQLIQSIVANAAIAWLHAVPQFRVKNAHALEKHFREVVEGGGEGLMLHRANAPYATGRSDDLLKLKPFEDAEAVVIAHVAGHGKFEGMLGSLEVETPAGVQFRVGSGFSDEVRLHPPVIGSVITYRFTGITAKGKPRFPRFLRVRRAE
ncbi:MAG: DNA ligase [Zetaproteobacteria bacterium]|nr:DNA ligase [Zetaproteobacteria bacterium]